MVAKPAEGREPPSASSIPHSGHTGLLKTQPTFFLQHFSQYRCLHLWHCQGVGFLKPPTVLLHLMQ